jgi:uncharacterized membrane protein YphA (DoxX/SURF4 family)
MDVVILIGRILFAALFLPAAFGHIAQSGPMTEYAKTKGVPAAKAAVLLGGVLLAVGGLSVLLGVWADLGSLALVVFLVPTALLMHPFWKETDAMSKQMEQIQFSKDLALAGASLMLFGFFAISGHSVGLTLTGPAFNLS